MNLARWLYIAGTMGLPAKRGQLDDPTAVKPFGYLPFGYSPLGYSPLGYGRDHQGASVSNPFRIGGTITGEYFTDRERELRTITATLSEPQAKLIVYGPRRMGKSSALEVAKAVVEGQGIPVVFVDVSTASGEADVAARLMRSAITALGRHWQDTVKQFARGLSARLSVSVDPTTQLPTIGIEPTIREASDEEQRARLGEVLETLEGLAAKRSGPVGVVLDEFQDIHKFGGEKAEWHLRGVIQRHKHLSYVLAGSRESLITAMVSDRNRAFYDLADRLHIGPIDGTHMAFWIDERFAGAGVEPRGCGSVIVRMAGSRTRDRVRLARATYAIAHEKGRITSEDVVHGLDSIVEEQAAEYFAVWRRLTPTQQNVLRAVAAGAGSLFSNEIRERFALGKASATTAKAVARLVDLEHLSRDEDREEYVFDSPFLGRWVGGTTLQDVGSEPPPLPT